MNPLDFIYEALSVAALGLAALSHKRDRGHAIQVAAMLCALCFACNATRAVKGYWVWPFLDACAAWFVAVRFRHTPARWKLIVVAMYVGQAFAHLRWQIGDKFGGPFYGYGLTLNALFLVQLGAVASSGSGRVWRYLCDNVGGRFVRRGVWRVPLLLSANARRSIRNEGRR